MSIQPVKMSTGRKIAITAGTIAAVGLGALAYSKGKQITDFAKAGDTFNGVAKSSKLNVFENLKEGFKYLFSGGAKETAQGVIVGLKKLFTKEGATEAVNKVKNKVDKGCDVVKAVFDKKGAMNEKDIHSAKYAELKEVFASEKANNLAEKVSQ